MHKRVLSLILFFSFSFLQLSCSTYLAIQEHEKSKPIIYGGTVYKIKSIANTKIEQLNSKESYVPDSAAYGLACLYVTIDFPLTIAADTILLPVTIPWAIQDKYFDDDANLAYYIYKKDFNKIKWYISRGADVKAKPGGYSVFCELCKMPKAAELVKMAIDRGANVNEIDEYNQTSPLDSAWESGDPEIIQLLYDNGANVMFRRIPSLCGLDYFTPNSKMIQLMIDHGANVNDTWDYNHRTPLMYAAYALNVDAVKALLKNKASVSSKDDFGYSPLIFALINDDDRELIRNGADARRRLDEISSTKEKTIQIVTLLLQAGASPNASEKQIGCTPLMFAVRRGDVEIAKLLLDNGARVNAVDKDGHNALTYAYNLSLSNIDEIIELLRKHGSIDDHNCTFVDFLRN